MLYTKVFIRQHTGVSLVVRHVDKLLSIAACPSLPPPQYICVNDFGRIVCCGQDRVCLTAYQVKPNNPYALIAIYDPQSVYERLPSEFMYVSSTTSQVTTSEHKWQLLKEWYFQVCLSTQPCIPVHNLCTKNRVERRRTAIERMTMWRPKLMPRPSSINSRLY